MSKRTVLYDEHLALGGRMVEFAGWSMPVQYKGVREEHTQTRERVSLFDVSHMGEIRVRGPQALATLQWLTTNDVSKLEKGQAHYSLLPNESGGLVDDIIVYCLEKNADYLVCVNASNKDKDFEWMSRNNKGAELRDESADWGQIAVQGPMAPALLRKVFGPVVDIPSFHHVSLTWKGRPVIFARTGYTGEDGGEIFVAADKAPELWRELLSQGAEWGTAPAGLGARDTLRTEMKYSLYGHEISDVTNPFEAGLGWVVKPSAKDFIGKGPMLAAKEKGLSRKLVGFKMKDKGIPRQGYKVGAPGPQPQVIGEVTSGTHSITLDQAIGIAYVATPHSALGSPIMIDLRGRWASAEVCETPFIKNKE